MNETRGRKGPRRRRRRAKPWYTSWTIWFNFISVVLVVTESQLELLRPVLSEGEYAAIAIGVASVNLYLRIFSGSALYLRKLPRSKLSAGEVGGAGEDEYTVR